MCTPRSHVRRRGIVWVTLFALTLLGPVGTISWTAAQAVRAGEDRWATILVDGRRRSYLVHTPPSRESTERLPLVIVLHGQGDTIPQTIRLTGMNEKAVRAGFIVVYPQGTGWLDLPPRSWNAGACCGYAKAKQVDDVTFIRRLIEKLEESDPIDPGKIYATGISNGGMMAYRLGCELTDRLAAIAPVAGALADARCTPSTPLSVIVFHGTADQHIRYGGGRSSMTHDQESDPPVPETVAWWAAHDRCTLPPTTERHGRVTIDRYTNCAQATDVVLYTMAGGTHTWPGGTHGWPFGTSPANDFSATDVLWEFFARHAKR